MKKYLPLNIYFRNLFYKKILLASIRFFFVLSTFFYLIFVTGCNKTGLKGTVIYGPTNSPIEGIEISAIPNLNTEERSSLTKSGTSDKNGEYKISGLETQYTYDLIVKNNKYKDVIDRKSLPNRIRAEVKDQTTLVKPIVLIDLLPGKKNYVKRQDGKFEELTPVPVSFIRTIKLTDRYNSTARCVNIDQIITLNPIKIKNGDIIFCGDPGSVATSRTFLYPIQKCTYDKKVENALTESNIKDIFFIGRIHAKLNFYEGYEVKEEDGGLGRQEYFYVNLPKGFYIYSSDRISHSKDPYIFEVIDEPNDEGDVAGDWIFLNLKQVYFHAVVGLQKVCYPT